MPGISLKGDYGKLRGLIATLKDFVGIGPLTTLSAALSEAALAEVRKGFRAETDPYDAAWSPLRKRKGRILRDTGRLLNSFSRTVIGKRGFMIGTNVEYASVHQFGAHYSAKGGVTNRRKGRFVSQARLDAKGTKKRGGLRAGYSTNRHGSHTIYIPQRAMLPLESRGLGARWTNVFERTTKRIMSRLLRRK